MVVLIQLLALLEPLLLFCLSSVVITSKPINTNLPQAFSSFVGFLILNCPEELLKCLSDLCAAFPFVLIFKVRKKQNFLKKASLRVQI